jgi:putative transposase
VQISVGGIGGLGYQVVWRPKYWQLVFGSWVAGQYGELIGTKAAGRGWRMVALVIMPDQVHLLVKAHPFDSLSQVASQFQAFRLRFLRTEFAHRRSRLPTLWPRPCLAATAGAVPTQAVRGSTGTQNQRPWRKDRER